MHIHTAWSRAPSVSSSLSVRVKSIFVWRSSSSMFLTPQRPSYPCADPTSHHHTRKWCSTSHIHIPQHLSFAHCSQQGITGHVRRTTWSGAGRLCMAEPTCLHFTSQSQLACMPLSLVTSLRGPPQRVDTLHLPISAHCAGRGRGVAGTRRTRLRLSAEAAEHAAPVLTG